MNANIMKEINFFKAEYDLKGQSERDYFSKDLLKFNILS